MCQPSTFLCGHGTARAGLPPLGPDGLPTDADVDAVHAKLCDAMVAAFDAQKEAFGWADRELEIL